MILGIAKFRIFIVKSANENEVKTSKNQVQVHYPQGHSRGNHYDYMRGKREFVAAITTYEID